MIYHRIFFLFFILLIGCVSTSKYESLQKSCDDNEKKLQDELNLEKEKFTKLQEECKSEKDRINIVTNAMNVCVFISLFK